MEFEIKPGPREAGFDYSFIMAATADRVPCVYVQNGRVVGLDPKDPIEVSYQHNFPGEPTGKDNPELLNIRPSHGHDMSIVNGISRIGYMRGGKAALWKDEDMADTFTNKAVSFIEENKDRPFFLYFATHNIHVPRVPNPRYDNATTMGPRGNSIAEMDRSVGDLLSVLDQLKLTEKTLIVFTSDNGPVVDDGYKDEAVEKLGNHKPAVPWRGGKYSIFEGGTRVPFIVHWPGRVKPGVSDALVCQVDFHASFAELVGQPLDTEKQWDSRNQLAALLGDSKEGRDSMIEDANGRAVRAGSWKYIPPRPGVKRSAANNVETGNDPQGQLYDVSAENGETTNVIGAHPEKVAELNKILDTTRDAGRHP